MINLVKSMFDGLEIILADKNIILAGKIPHDLKLN